MKRHGTSIATIIFLSLAIVVFGSGAAAEHDHHRATPEASPMADEEISTSMGVAYLTISNNGDQADRLLGIRTDAAAAVEVHEAQTDDGVMQMHPLHDGLELPAGETVLLEPGDAHIMLVGLTESLIAGEEYELTLTFEKAGEVTVTVPILRTEPEDNEGAGGPVEAGNLTIGNIWSRQAPKIGGSMGTPMASPGATAAQ